jgi:mannose-6-phosphate isomerase-like protein (cupin superfamily)
MSDTVRRVVTGESPEGKGIFHRVEEVQPIESHFDWYGVWGWDSPPVLPMDPEQQFVPPSSFPPVEAQNGVRVSVVDFPPIADPRSKPRTDDEVAEMMRAGRIRERDTSTGMHRTDSVEVAFVISGEMCLKQDGDSEVTLRPGDCLVQNGANHAWKNRTDAMCRIAFVTFAATRESD